MLELRPVQLPAEYRKKWNETCPDFVHIYVDGKKVSDTYYRVGGVNPTINRKRDGILEGLEHCTLLKYIEARYEGKETTPGSLNHLESHWCIVNQKGEEVVVSRRFNYIYIVGDCIYKTSDNNSYYNIKNGQCYGESLDDVLVSDDFIFVADKYNKDREKRGVLKIDTKTGEYELFKKS